MRIINSVITSMFIPALRMQTDVACLASLKLPESEESQASQ
ncbi:MAG: hypothetical protein ACOZCO_18430 [Bacteroidota bacterium]